MKKKTKRKIRKLQKQLHKHRKWNAYLMRELRSYQEDNIRQQMTQALSTAGKHFAAAIQDDIKTHLNATQRNEELK